MSDTTIRFSGSLPVRLRRELEPDEELTFSVTAKVDAQEFDIETGRELLDFRIVRAHRPDWRRADP